MPILDDWSLTVDIDAVLRGQGADPSAIRGRSPRLVRVAERALDEGRPLLAPKVLYQRLEVEELRHEQVRLRGGHRLRGALLAQHLGGAREVVLILCTIGEALETHASKVSKDNMLYGLALDGVASAGVETLSNAVCVYFEGQAQIAGLQTTIPLSPGMLGWPVEKGQPQIFEILDPSQVGIRLSPSMLMIPRKSLTFVLGIGTSIVESARTCDYCSLKESCRYQGHHA